jgi:hypothetical protein
MSSGVASSLSQYTILDIEFQVTFGYQKLGVSLCCRCVVIFA